MDIRAFFKEERIDVFSEVSIINLVETDRESVVRYFPEAQSVIVFGREVPALAYLLPPKQKTLEMLRIAEGLDRSAVRLADILISEHVPALSVPLYLPVRIVEGRIMGLIRLKQVAAAGRLGSIGMNSVLLSHRYGPRLLLSGVVIGRPAPQHVPGNQEGSGINPADSPICTGCGRCIKVCPGEAIGPDGVDAFRCRTISAWIPRPLVPTVKFLVGRKMLLKGMASLAPWIARTATIQCSLCVTECPEFNRAEESEKFIPPEMPAGK